MALWVHGVYKDRITDTDVSKLVGYGIPMVATLEVFDNYARAQDGPRVPSPLERQMAPAALLDSFYPIPDDFDIGSLG